MIYHVKSGSLNCDVEASDEATAMDIAIQAVKQELPESMAILTEVSGGQYCGDFTHYMLSTVVLERAGMLGHMELTTEQLQTLRHMLGIDKPAEREPEPYRDYAAAPKGSAEFAELARLGAVRLYSQEGSYDWYTTTLEGRAAAIASHRAIRLPKPKRVYSKYLDIADVHCGLTFREFLTSPDYADARSAA